MKRVATGVSVVLLAFVMGSPIPRPLQVPPADFMTGGGFFRPPNAYPPHHVN